MGGASPGTGKRRSSFLHTLSRLTNNSSSRRPGSSGGGGAPPSSFPSSSYTPSTAASEPDPDPFGSTTPTELGERTPEHQPTPSLSALSSYLTTVSNDPKLRTSRAWKRFVRVRADDLESARVERAIKRVRSDLASHLPAPTMGGVGASMLSLGPSFNAMGLSPEGGFQSEQEEEVTEMVVSEKRASTIQDKRLSAQDKRLSAVMGLPSAFSSDSDSAHAQAVVVEGTPTPGTVDLPKDHHPPTEPTEVELPPSPIATHHPPTSLARVPSRKRLPPKKVGVDDFEMMRVLGKGCAGKVLLVKYKRSGDLYALKAITKRHVLAHQELQHTLTEQAVLKRMSRENKDPFVVKLWWSFHDRDNLFLVMVRIPMLK